MARVRVASCSNARAGEVLTPEAIAFVAHLSRRFLPRLEQLLARRQHVQARYDAGEKLDFLLETQHVREDNWKVRRYSEETADMSRGFGIMVAETSVPQVGPLPVDLLDRRVEITGPVDRKMVINALNSGASVFMADFEDSNAPSWCNPCICENIV